MKWVSFFWDTKLFLYYLKVGFIGGLALAPILWVLESCGGIL